MRRAIIGAVAALCFAYALGGIEATGQSSMRLQIDNGKIIEATSVRFTSPTLTVINADGFTVPLPITRLTSMTAILAALPDASIIADLTSQTQSQAQTIEALRRELAASEETFNRVFGSQSDRQSALSDSMNRESALRAEVARLRQRLAEVMQQNDYMMSLLTPRPTHSDSLYPPQSSTVVEVGPVTSGVMLSAPEDGWRILKTWNGHGQSRTEPIQISSAHWKVRHNFQSSTTALFSVRSISVNGDSDLIANTTQPGEQVSSCYGAGTYYFDISSTADHWSIAVEVPRD